MFDHDIFAAANLFIPNHMGVMTNVYKRFASKLLHQFLYRNFQAISNREDGGKGRVEVTVLNIIHGGE